MISPSAKRGRMVCSTIVGARGLVEQRLGARVHLGVLQIVDDFADLLADGGSTGLAGGENGIAHLAQVFDEIGDVGGLTGAFRAF